MKRKRVFASVLASALVLGNLTLPENISFGKLNFGTLFAQAAEDEESVTTIPEEITLYAVDESLQEYICVPDDFPQTYSLAGHTWSIESGESVEIDDDGTISIAGTTWYYHRDDSGWWVGSTGSSGSDDEISYYEYSFGDTVILIDDSVSLTVHAVSYATYYAEKTMDDYLAENITAEMSEYEIADLCCQFVAGYDYSTEASGYTSMIVTGGGDCWASTDTLLYMLKQEGISCASRDASTDSDAGSQHVNVVAQLDGAYYILDAGYTGTAPRSYTMEQMNSSSVFTYEVRSSNTAYITGLVLDEGITELTIPEEIDGYTVTGIADGAFSTNHNLVSVYLPDTVTYLGEKAFYYNDALKSIRLSESLTTIGANCFAWNKSLEEIEIPASVTTINSNVFCYCDVLSAIHVAEDNQIYTSMDGVLFDKDMVTLLIFPAGKSNNVSSLEYDESSYLSQLETDYLIPDGVECIAGWAFAGVDLHSVTFPDSVTEIQSYAFYNTYIYSVELPTNMTTVSSYAFQDCTMHALTIPSGVQTIEEYAFYQSSFEEITILEGVTSIGAYAFAGIGAWEGIVKLPASVKEIGENAFYFMYGWSSMDSSSTSSNSTSNLSPLFFEEGCAPDSIGDGAFTSTVLCVYEGSDMYKYAVENDLAYYLVNADGTVELQSNWLSKINTCLVYTGEAKTPSLKWNTSDGICPFGLHQNAYQVTYSDNINIGTCTITVTGVGLFSGEITTTFKIYAADPSADVIDRSGCGLQYSISQG